MSHVDGRKNYYLRQSVDGIVNVQYKTYMYVTCIYITYDTISTEKVLLNGVRKDPKPS